MERYRSGLLLAVAILELHSAEDVRCRIGLPLANVTTNKDAVVTSPAIHGRAWNPHTAGSAQGQILSTALTSWVGEKGLTIQARAPACLPFSRIASWLSVVSIMMGVNL